MTLYDDVKAHYFNVPMTGDILEDVKRVCTANQATHGKVTHQAAPGYKLGYSIFSCQEQGVYYTPLHLKTG